MPDNDPAQRQFDVLYGTLADLQKAVGGGTTQTAGFLLLAIGWLATSDSAMRLLHSRPSVRYMTAAALAGAFGIFVSATSLIYVRSQATYKMLVALNFMPQEYYSNNLVTLPELLIFIAGTFALFGLGVGLILGAY